MTVTTVRSARSALSGYRLAWPWLAILPVAVLAVAAPGAALVVWAVLVIGAAMIDARRCRLPDRVVVPGIALMILVALSASAVERSWGPTIETAAGAVVLAGPLALMHVVSPAGLGFGDVKYGALLGAGIGSVGAAGGGLLVLVVAGLLQLVVVWARPWPAQHHPGATRGAAPFGPSLAMASIGWVVMVLVTGGV